ncbi:DUF551 domain-containing protein [[Ruminococcus] gnavus]|uniref:DUF551 domain-containing protein n=1 Tax=Mediterraneibacter gnavus TaxID=33038 RepID=UPI002286B6AB|nr:DUF551 domain-containing protein [Mediterraneibacter gnavus]MCZ0646762.1 DUF551 domain-containing protein [Mediterraneibacter gnavus]
MNVLEKILEEIGNASIKVSTVGLPHKYFKAIGTKKIEEIIRSNMDDVPDNNAGWIPVSERLPEGKEVIAQNKDGEMLIGYVYYSEEMEWYECVSESMYLTNVIAWQPLPEPYKEE